MSVRPGIEILRHHGAPVHEGSFTVRVFTPSVRAEGGYALLLMADGQNLFDLSGDGPSSWGVDASIEGLVRAGVIPPCLVVGVDHRGSARLGDYAPWRDPRLPFEVRGDRYAAFVAESLLPMLAARYPLRPGAENRALAGSSMGGLISLYVAWRYPGLFGRVAGLSPTVMLGRHQLARVWSRHPRTFQKVYLDAGERERFDTGLFVLDYGAAAVEFHEHLSSLGYAGHELCLVRDPGGEHGEADWRRRFPDAMAWLFN